MNAVADLLQTFRADPYARLLGMEVEDVRPGWARVSMELGPQHRTFHGVVHGGAIFSLADAAFAVASNSHDRRAVALSVNVHFHRVPAPGRLVAECSEEHLGRTVASYRVEVRDAQGRRVATMQGLVYRRDVPVADAEE
ncbi:MAG: PaaI family thioesterase [Armatimonadota bacterium]|nr:PaaI family thioesterase [Armatimonadota bacterium]MDR5696263.1 PaaI family thioesterase [Armatimonadota bacterium]